MEEASARMPATFTLALYNLVLLSIQKALATCCISLRLAHAVGSVHVAMEDVISLTNAGLT